MIKLYLYNGAIKHETQSRLYNKYKLRIKITLVRNHQIEKSPNAQKITYQTLKIDNKVKIRLIGMGGIERGKGKYYRVYTNRQIQNCFITLLKKKKEEKKSFQSEDMNISSQ